MNYGEKNYLQAITNYIPEELKKQRRWVLWGHCDGRTEYREKEPWQIPNQNGQIYRAKSSDSNTWSDFASAHYFLKEAFESPKQSWFKGIGFQTGGGFVGIDIDHCVTYSDEDDLLEFPIIDPDVMAFMKSLNTYWEVSPGRYGVHGFAYYDGFYRQVLPNQGQKIEVHIPAPDNPKRERHFEFYLSGQYIRISGNLIHGDLFGGSGVPILGRNNDVLDKYVEQLSEGPQKENKAVQTPDPDGSGKKIDLSGPVLTDEQVLEYARTALNSEKFESLWSDENSEFNPQHDRSRGDQSLANILIFFTGGDGGRDAVQLVNLLQMAPRWERHGRRKEEMAIRCTKFALKKLLEDPQAEEHVFRPGMSAEQMFGALNPDSGKAPEGLMDEDMLPLNMAERLPFPLRTLPAGLQEFVTEVARETSSPVDFAACGLLTVASMALAGKYIVRVHEQHTSPISLYTMIVGSPAVAKSPVFKKLLKPVNEYCAHLREETAPLILEREAERKILNQKKSAIEGELEKQVQIAEGTATRKKDKEADPEEAEQKIQELKARLIQVETDLENNPEIHKPVLYVNGDITGERFVDVLGEQNGRLSILCDEAATFVDIVSGGKYGKGVPTIDPFIQVFEEGTVQQLRRSRNVTIPHTSGSILLFTQPVVKERFINNPDMKGQGLSARFLVVEPKTTMIDPNADHGPADPGALFIYENTIRNLLDLPYREPGTIGAMNGILEMTEEAAMMFEEYRISVTNSGRAEDGEHAGMADVAGKHGNKALRLAGILHCIKHPVKYTWEAGKPDNSPTGSLIDAQTMQEGIDLADYFLSHAEYQYGVSTGETGDKALKLIKKLLANAQKETQDILTAKDFQKMYSRDPILGKAKTLQPVLEFLEERNVLATREDLKTKSKTKRSACGPFQVNQKLFTDEGLKQLGLEPSKVKPKTK